MMRLGLVVFACLLTGCAGTTSSIPVATPTSAAQIPIEVNKPDGPGPFPAVVIAHD
jgi:hypothetical protein